MSAQRNFMPKQKKKKMYLGESDIGPSPLKVDADADGRVGIWKAPLSLGTSELTKTYIWFSSLPK